MHLWRATVGDVTDDGWATITPLEGPFASIELSEPAEPAHPPGSLFKPAAGDVVLAGFRDPDGGAPFYLASTGNADALVVVDRAAGTVDLANGGDAKGVARVGDGVNAAGGLPAWMAAVKADLDAMGALLSYTTTAGPAPTAIGEVAAGSGSVFAGD